MTTRLDHLELKDGTTYHTVDAASRKLGIPYYAVLRIIARRNIPTLTVGKARLVQLDAIVRERLRESQGLPALP